MRSVNVTGLMLLGVLLAGCGTAPVEMDIEPPASASADEWKAIQASVHEVYSSYKPWDVAALGTVLQQVHTKMCAPGTHQMQLQLLTNKLKFKASALGATGIAQLEVHVVPLWGEPPAGSPCAAGYMEGTATALILDKARFPNLYPEYRDGSVNKLPN